MQKTKIYISGKISGLDQYEVGRKFELAKIELQKQDYEVISPMDLPHNHGKSWQEFMKEDIAALMTCDCIYALKDWRDSAGAKIEIELAYKLGLDVKFQK